MDLKVNKRNKYISNGCRRHVRFMKILKRDISCVGDWFEKKNFLFILIKRLYGDIFTKCSIKC